MLEKYDGGVSKDIYKIVTGDKSCIYAYEPEKKTVLHVGLRRQAKSNESCLWKKNTSKQMVACFFGKIGYVAMMLSWCWPLEQRCTINSEWYTIISLEKRQCEFFCIGSNQMGQSPYRPGTLAPWHPMTYFYFRTSWKYCVVYDFRQTQIFVKLVFSTHCKQHKWCSYVKTFWAHLCLKMSNFPIKISNCTWQYQKYARPETYLANLVTVFWDHFEKIFMSHFFENINI